MESSDTKKQKALTAAETEAKELAELNNAEDWGVPVLTQKDIIIPRLLLMQPMSEKVTAGTAAFGEIIDSLNNAKLGGFEKPPIEIVPFLMEKTWVIFDNSDPEDKKYLRIEPVTPDNENAKYDDEEKNEDGDVIKISRIRTQTFYVLLVSELKEGAATPYVIAFSKSSLQAGKKISSQMYMKNINAGKNPAAMVMGLTCGKRSEEKKTWAVFDAAVASETPIPYQKEAKKWLKIIKEGKAKVDENAFAGDDELVKEKTVAPKEKVDLSEPSDY